MFYSMLSFYLPTCPSSLYLLRCWFFYWKFPPLHLIPHVLRLNFSMTIKPFTGPSIQLSLHFVSCLLHPLDFLPCVLSIPHTKFIFLDSRNYLTWHLLSDQYFLKRIEQQDSESKNDYHHHCYHHLNSINSLL